MKDNDNDNKKNSKPETGNDSEFSKGFWRTLGKITAVAVVGGVGYGLACVFPPAAPLAAAATSAVANS